MKRSKLAEQPRLSPRAVGQHGITGGRALEPKQLKAFWGGPSSAPATPVLKANGGRGLWN